ncbi:hypothetical protein BGZ63DRAFT_405452 [Mariannaea sp. PMI_226]|nr:hypothetical protein BGZ63DRAFT_405452 [Mariannaea sp. PMI_226]
MFPSHLWLSATWLMAGAFTAHAQTATHGSKNKPDSDALYKVRAQLCDGGKYSNVNCGAVNDKGANTAACWEFNGDHPSYQGLIIGNNPPQQDCWDAFDAIIKNKLLGAHLEEDPKWGGAATRYYNRGVYTYSGRTYLMVTDST